MDATTIVAIAGLASTATVGLVVPIINGRMNDRNARRAKSHDLAIAAYTDAMAYLQHAEIRLDGLVDVEARFPDDAPASRGTRNLISARLRLVAAPDVLDRWRLFLIAEDHLYWYLREYPNMEYIDDQGLPEDLPVIAEVRRTAWELSEALRRAVGAANLTPQRRVRIRRISS